MSGVLNANKCIPFITGIMNNSTRDDAVPISSVDGGDIVFKNSQRVFIPEGLGTSLFMRTTEGNLNVSENNNPTIRLLFESPLGYQRQILIGMNENTSDGFDMGYDAFIADVNEEDMYWTFEGGKFVIQSVNNFNETQEFPLSVIIKENGFASFKIDQIENLNTNEELYIKDNNTGQTHQINNNPFEVYLEEGIYDGRFELVFQQQSLSTNDIELEEEISIYQDSDTSELIITKKTDLEIFDVTLYSILGQNIKTLKMTSNNVFIPESVSAGVYILNLNTSKGIINKKIIIK